MLLLIAREAGQLFLADIRKDDEAQKPPDTRQDFYLLEALVRVHIRACRVAAEVLALLKCGYADGAIARWRSLHEDAVIATFIAKHGEETARRYLCHSHIDRYLSAIQFREHCERLNSDFFSADEMADIEQQYNEAITEFSEHFEDEYGWVVTSPTKKRTTFRQLESCLDMSHWRPYYRLACRSVHASPQGLYATLSGGPDQALLAGASDSGLADPAQCTAISLMLVSTALLTARRNLDGIVASALMQQLCKDICKAFIGDDENEPAQ